MSGPCVTFNWPLCSKLYFALSLLTLAVGYWSLSSTRWPSFLLSERDAAQWARQGSAFPVEMKRFGWSLLLSSRAREWWVQVVPSRVQIWGKWGKGSGTVEKLLMIGFAGTIGADDFFHLFSVVCIRPCCCLLYTSDAADERK